MNTTRFKKGFTPWNKNLKGIHLSPQSEFKAGRIAANRVPIGTISIRLDVSGSYRNRIKIAERQWIDNAIYVWQKANGRRLPKGCLVHHIDKNTLNDVIENLQLLTRKEHFNHHGIGAMGRAAHFTAAVKRYEKHKLQPDMFRPEPEIIQEDLP